MCSTATLQTNEYTEENSAELKTPQRLYLTAFPPQSIPVILHRPSKQLLVYVLQVFILTKVILHILQMCEVTALKPQCFGIFN